jgi:hypothetical protein
MRTSRHKSIYTKYEKSWGEEERRDEANEDIRKGNLWLTHGFMIGGNQLDITGRT